MANTSALYPGSAPTDSGSGGSVAWSSASAAQTENGSGATLSLASKQGSNYLLCQNFLPAVPGSATLGNVVAEVRGKATGVVSSPYDVAVSFIDETGTQQNGGSASVQDCFTGSFGYVTFTLDGSTWTPTTVNGALSGLAIRGSAGNGVSVSLEIDTIRATYYYTPAPSGYLQLLLMGCGSVLAPFAAWAGLPRFAAWLRGERSVTRRLYPA